MVFHICEICNGRYTDVEEAKKCESKGLINMYSPIGSVFHLTNSVLYDISIIGLIYHEKGSHYPNSYVININLDDKVIFDKNINDYEYDKLIRTGRIVFSNENLEEIGQEKFDKSLESLYKILDWVKTSDYHGAKRKRSFFEDYLKLKVENLKIIRGTNSNLNPNSIENRNILIFQKRK